MTRTTEEYKGFTLNYFISRKGFNEYTVTITKYKHPGTRIEEYYFHRLSTYAYYKSEARKKARFFIDSIGEINWSDNGQANNPNILNCPVCGCPEDKPYRGRNMHGLITEGCVAEAHNKHADRWHNEHAKKGQGVN